MVLYFSQGKYEFCHTLIQLDNFLFAVTQEKIVIKIPFFEIWNPETPSTLETPSTSSIILRNEFIFERYIYTHCFFFTGTLGSVFWDNVFALLLIFWMTKFQIWSRFGDEPLSPSLQTRSIFKFSLIPETRGSDSEPYNLVFSSWFSATFYKS